MDKGMDNWSEKLKKEIHKNLNDVKERDIRFFRIPEFFRNIERTEFFYSNCPECKMNKIEVESIVVKIHKAIKVPGKARKDYDRLTGQISRHMMHKHGFYAPFYFTYLYSFLGMIGGLVLGYFGTKIFSKSGWMILVVFFIFGLLLGHVLGSRRDNKIRSENKLM